MKGSVLVAAAVIAALCAAVSSGSATGRGASAQRLLTGPLQTAVVEPLAADRPETAPLLFDRARASGATVFRLELAWRAVAPRSRPGAFDPANPDDPAYSWETFDRQVQAAVSAGLAPLVYIAGAPDWAERGARGPPGTRSPDPAELGLFARAAAVRYGGSRAGLPRVRLWQLWNEPNDYLFLNTQFEGDRPVSPQLYRDLLRAFAESVHGVHSDNLVVTGGLTPFGRSAGQAVSPLRFMRDLLCMSGGKNPRPTCADHATFDVWSHHPYTEGGPRHHALSADNVSLGDLPRMRGLLQAAVAAGHVDSTQPIRFWVTEFSWDSNPPDPMGVPAALEGQWVAEAMFRMWQSGVSLVTWYLLVDRDSGPYQSGLYYRDKGGSTVGKPKPAQRAFRFPFVALPAAKSVTFWGRTPSSGPGTVFIERKVGSQWAVETTVAANRLGIFRGRVPGRRTTGFFRARVGAADVSLPFPLRPTPDLPVRVFGQ
jgi:hypothetical protein